MKTYTGYHNYEKFPKIKVSEDATKVIKGYKEIKQTLTNKAGENGVIVLEFYPGVDKQEVIKGFGLTAENSFDAEECFLPTETYETMIAENLTDDRVFGVLTTHKLREYFSSDAIAQMKAKIEARKGIVFVYGVGASFITTGDVLVYLDMARWEIQNRYKRGMSNMNGNNSDAPQLSKYKRGFFVDWRLADRHKKTLYTSMDYVLDTNESKNPKLIDMADFKKGMQIASVSPFRLVPYFDPGVWGGQWMKEVCGLPPEKENYAWSFDGVPEENSLLLAFGEETVEVPAINLVFLHPQALLGERVHARFGAEFPIRFDFLDTMEGQNLSLQVHPLTEYIQENFGMHYTQDESYYLLDCAEDTYVYLGVKNEVNPTEMIEALKTAQTGTAGFDAEKYVNKIPVKKHDHVLIPAGTVHCSGSDTMVLEISATPFIFTFKLWDWDRLGLDGLPRPIHIEHGEKVIDFTRNTDWVYAEIVNHFETLHKEEGHLRERTGLHEREFIETVRDMFEKPVRHETHGSVNMLNLIEGEEARVISTDGSFEPFIVHYAETFIIPACVTEYIIEPTEKSKGQKLGTIKAYVRG